MRTTLAGWVTGLLAFWTQPDLKHALLGLGLAILGALARDAKVAEN